MSNLGPMGGPRRITTPTPPSGETIGRYGTYSEAQRAVDFLSDEHFPVQNVTIVGTGLQMVERVTGRLTYGRAAGAGAASGAWFGLLIGLMLSVFGPGGSGALLTGILVGAGFGMLFGVISYALTGGRRDFTSSSQIVASEYTVLCLPQLAGQAREVLSRLPNGLGRDSGTPSGQSRGVRPTRRSARGARRPAAPSRTCRRRSPAPVLPPSRRPRRPSTRPPSPSRSTTCPARRTPRRWRRRVVSGAPPRPPAPRRGREEEERSGADPRTPHGHGDRRPRGGRRSPSSQRRRVSAGTPSRPRPRRACGGGRRTGSRPRRPSRARRPRCGRRCRAAPPAPARPRS